MRVRAPGMLDPRAHKTRRDEPQLAGSVGAGGTPRPGVNSIARSSTSSRGRKMELLTSETWSEDEPRAKYKVGDKVVYVLQGPPGSAPMHHELEMMRLASSVGVRVPLVHSYSRTGNLEVSVLEYVEGRSLTREPEDARARDAARRALESMEALQRTGAVVGSHLIFPGGAEYPSSKEVYAYWVRQVVGLKKLFGAQGPDADVEWLESVLPREPCVLMHGDPSDDNVVVTPEGICLIDWECAGFMPRTAARAMSGTLSLSDTASQVVDCLYMAVKHSMLKELPEFSAQLSRLESIRLASLEPGGKSVSLEAAERPREP